MFQLHIPTPSFEESGHERIETQCVTGKAKSRGRLIPPFFLLKYVRKISLQDISRQLERAALE